MKKVSREFIRKIKSYNYPEDDKGFLATKLIYNAYQSTSKASGSKISTSAKNDIISTYPGLKDVYDKLAYSYYSKREFKELSEKCNSVFRPRHHINEEVYDLIDKLLGLTNSDLLLHVNAPDETFIVKSYNNTTQGTIKQRFLVIPDNPNATDCINMRLTMSEISFTSVDSINKTIRFKPQKIFINPCYKYLDKNYRYFGRDNNIWNEIEELVQFLDHNSKMIALIPNVMLSNSLDKLKKESIINMGYLEGIISLPLRYYSDTLSVEVSLLIFSKNNDAVKITDINEIFTVSDIKSADLDSITEYIVDSYANNYKVVHVNEIVKNSSNLLITNIITEDLYTGIYCPVLLSSRAEVRKGTKKTKIKFNDFIDQSGESSYCLLSSNDIDEDGIKYGDLTSVIYDSSFDDLIAKNGDVVITNKSSNIKIAVIECEDKKIIPIGGMIIISPTEETLDGMYLKLFFESEKGSRIFSKVKRGQRTNTINSEDVKLLNIPGIDYSEQLELSKKYKLKYNELLNKKVEFKQKQKEINDILKEI